MTISPRVLILRAPGTNCDEETQHAFELAGAECQKIHINRLLENTDLLDQFQILCFPGGFSYGDDVAAGRILASQLTNRLSDALNNFRDSEKLILGICNGFQIMLKSGLFEPTESSDNAQPIENGNVTTPVGTLTWNDHGRFEDRWVDLSANESKCVFLRNVERMYLPVAHAEGKFVFRDAQTRHDMANKDQLCLSYCESSAESENQAAVQNSSTALGTASVGESNTGLATSVARTEKLTEVLGFPANPNGSQANVAGICDSTGRVFGLMPHPERHVEATQHPRWTREGLADRPDGLAVFENAVEFFSR